jgi:creatinine amidohydrolase
VSKHDGYIMQYMTVEEMRDALTQTKTAILPVGVIEQHGYHLPLYVDVYNAYEIAKLVSPLVNCLVAPPVQYSFSGGTLPGTLDISPQLLSLLLMELCASLANQGIENIVILLGHGGSENQKATYDAADMFFRRNPHYRYVKLALVPFTDLAPSVAQAFEKRDFHAGELETSLMLYWHPEEVRDRSKWVTDSQELMDIFYQDQDAYQVRLKPMDSPAVCPVILQHPDMEVGVMCQVDDLRNANAEYGKKIIDECVSNLVDLIKQLERSEYPESAKALLVNR